MIQNAKKRVIDSEGKVLLALSGGPDSISLFYLLLESKKFFHIAHVDHGLLETSGDVRKKIEKLAEENDIPFHSIILEASTFPKNNLEDFLREKRISFFQKVLKEEKLDLVMLGHQKDERAETVIKRFFEGGDISHLGGMEFSSVYEGMDVCRPLLDCLKKDVLSYLEKKGAWYFTDPTNIGEENLRARMRLSLIPSLEERFGKNISASVCDTADQVKELTLYLESRVQEYKKRGVKGTFGVFFPKEEGEELVLFTLIMSFLRSKMVLVSREERAQLKRFIAGSFYGKRIVFKQAVVCFEQAGVFLLETEKLKFQPYLSLEEISWIDFWKEGYHIKGIKKVTLKDTDSLKNSKVLSEYHRVRKTPIFLRKLFPIPLTTITEKFKITHV